MRRAESRSGAIRLARDAGLERVFPMRPIGVVRSPYQDRRRSRRARAPSIAPRARSSCGRSSSPGCRTSRASRTSSCCGCSTARRASTWSRRVPLDQEIPHGVFASRSPRRPNPIGLTVVELARPRGRAPARARGRHARRHADPGHQALPVGRGAGGAAPRLGRGGGGAAGKRKVRAARRSGGGCGRRPARPPRLLSQSVWGGAVLHEPLPHDLAVGVGLDAELRVERAQPQVQLRAGCRTARSGSSGARRGSSSRRTGSPRAGSGAITVDHLSGCVGSMS